MPLYQFQCADCETRFERLVRNEEEEKKASLCPYCESREVKKLPSLFGKVCSVHARAGKSGGG